MGQIYINLKALINLWMIGIFYIHIQGETSIVVIEMTTKFVQISS